MPVLFVTSFTRKMFSVTGSRLVRSFLQSGTDGSLLLCHEGFNADEPCRAPRIRNFRLERSALLTNWLQCNRDIIPIRYGGEAGECGCAEPRRPFGLHRGGCHSFWFNLNASRYFRKVISLDYAMRLREYGYVVWVDSDCVIRRKITTRRVGQWFNGHDVFYHRSPMRRVIESGVLGVRNSSHGRLFIETTLERYRSGAFRNNVRWDDGYQFQLVLRNRREIAAVDLATGATGPKPYGHVLPHSPAGAFIAHYKGTHAHAMNLL